MRQERGAPAALLSPPLPRAAHNLSRQTQCEGKEAPNLPLAGLFREHLDTANKYTHSSPEQPFLVNICEVIVVVICLRRNHHVLETFSFWRLFYLQEALLSEKSTSTPSCFL
jgi:hypothetical protein